MDLWVWHPVMGFRPMLAWSLLIGGLVVLVYLRVMRRQPRWASGLMVWRLCLVLMLLGLLAGPSRMPIRSHAAGESHLHLLVDVSGSMRRSDAGGKTRWSAVTAWLDDASWSALEKDHRVTLRGFHDRLQPLMRTDLHKAADQVAQGRRSSASGAIEQLLRQVPQGQKAQIVWFGDGRESEGLVDVAALAKEKQVVIHAVAVGGQTETPDLALMAEPPASFLMADEQGQLLVTVRRSGMSGPQKAKVHVLLEGGASLSHTVQWEQGQWAAAWAMPIRHEKAGRYRYRLRVEPMEGETVTANNRWDVVVRVAPGPLKVLVLEAEPFWDTKFLAQALRRDRRLVVHQITQIASDRPLQRMSTRREDALALPESISDWAMYDVVILGRGLEKMLPTTAGQQLQAFVRSGGGLVLARGRAYDPDTPQGQRFAKAMGLLEPVRFGVGLIPGEQMAWTAMGRSSAISNLGRASADAAHAMGTAPKLDFLHVVEQVKPSARVLVRSGQAPWLVEMGYGRGRVVSALGEGLWRWRLQRGPGSDHRALYEAFWSNVVRDLAIDGLTGDAQIDLQASSQNVRLGDPVHWTVRARDAIADLAGVQLTIKDPEGSVQTVPLRPMSGHPERLEGQFVPSRSGHWEAALVNPVFVPRDIRRSVVAFDLDAERLHSAARPGDMRRVAEATGGLFFHADQKVDLAERLAQRRAQTMVDPKPEWAWDRGWVLALILTWAGLEWIGRRSIGWL